jgi:hypothetical protein
VWNVSHLRAYMDQYFPVVVASLLAWIVLVAIASAIYRRIKGKAIITNVPANSIFVEQWTSGRSLRSVVTRIFGARNCLLVAVTDKALIVHPHFPFSLMFFPEVYGLDWTIPRAAIRRVEIRSGMRRERTIVEFKSSRGEVDRVELKLRDPESFRAALAK